MPCFCQTKVVYPSSKALTLSQELPGGGLYSVFVSGLQVIWTCIIDSLLLCSPVSWGLGNCEEVWTQHLCPAQIFPPGHLLGSSNPLLASKLAKHGGRGVEEGMFWGDGGALGCRGNHPLASSPCSRCPATVKSSPRFHRPPAFPRRESRGSGVLPEATVRHWQS